MAKWLTLQAGSKVKEKIVRDGISRDDITTLVGASGGPKWLVLSQVDRVLSRWLTAERTTPLDMLGSSIGAFRHAAYAHPRPDAALERLERAYIAQTYVEKPSPDYVTKVSYDIVEALLAGSAGDVASNDTLRCHVVTMRSRGATASEHPLALKAGLGLSALANLFSRRATAPFYERVVFSRGGTRFRFPALATRVVSLNADNLPHAIVASGSIPLVMAGVRDIPGALPGMYRDGGIMDYHFDLRCLPKSGIALYPHFFNHVSPGWFDKPLAWRRPHLAKFEHLLHISPSPEMVARLPGGRIPDRTDFVTKSTADRQADWWRVVGECQRMADELEELLSTGRLHEHVKGTEQLASA